MAGSRRIPITRRDGVTQAYYVGSDTTPTQRAENGGPSPSDALVVDAEVQERVERVARILDATQFTGPVMNSPAVAAALQGVVDEQFHISVDSLHQQLMINPDHVDMDSDCQVEVSATIVTEPGSRLSLESCQLRDSAVIQVTANSDWTGAARVRPEHTSQLRSTVVSGSATIATQSPSHHPVRLADTVVTDHAMVTGGSWARGAREAATGDYTKGIRSYGRTRIGGNAIVDGADIRAFVMRDKPQRAKGSLFKRTEGPGISDADSIRIDGNAYVKGTVHGGDIHITGTAVIQPEMKIGSFARVSAPHHTQTIPLTSGATVTVYRALVTEKLHPNGQRSQECPVTKGLRRQEQYTYRTVITPPPNAGIFPKPLTPAEQELIAAVGTAVASN